MAEPQATPTMGVSPQVREMAEQNVAQAKKAYDQYVTTVERVFNTMEDAMRHAWTGARDVNLRMVSFADANAKAGFEYADRLAKAVDAKEFATIGSEYLRETAERLGQQLRELNELATQAAREAVEAAQPKP